MSSSDKFLASFGLIVAGIFATAYFFGIPGVLIFLLGLALVGVATLLRYVYRKILNAWEEYKHEQAQDAQEIVNRLAART